jgi:hypothetical protein
LPESQYLGVPKCHVKIPAGGLRTGHNPQAVFQACIASFHLHQAVTYQPESRYWTLQWIELGLFMALVLSLAALAIWWVRRRLS